ncbi:MAG: nickel/cobalt transporter [Reyranellaceae bacterium]
MRRRALVLAALAIGCLVAGASVAVAAEPAAAVPVFLGDAVDSVVARVGRWQSEANRALAAEVRAIRRGEGLPAVLALVAVGFLYGVVHALGPGHGKAIVAAYFMDRQRHWSAAIFAGGWIALGHTISAILIVLVLAVILRGAALDVIDQTRVIEIIAYGLILAIGLWRLLAGLRGAPHCHAHGDPHHDHDHHHGHDHDHGHAHGPSSGWRLRLRQFLRPDAMLGLLTVAGAVPCSGAMILLLFSLANGLLPVGLLGAFAISLGMALTLIVLGFTAVILRLRFVDGLGRGQAWLQRGMTIAGGALVSLAGGLMLAAVLARPL